MISNESPGPPPCSDSSRPHDDPCTKLRPPVEVQVNREAFLGVRTMTRWRWPSLVSSKFSVRRLGFGLIGHASSSTHTPDLSKPWSLPSLETEELRMPESEAWTWSEALLNQSQRVEDDSLTLALLEMGHHYGESMLQIYNTVHNFI